MRRTTGILLFLLIGLSSLSSYGQKTYKINSDSKVLIHGTSTLHDWTIEAQDISGTAKAEASGELKNIDQLTFKIRTESIESGKSKMNNYTYEALKSEEHPYISFSLANIKNIGSGKVSAEGFVTIAGVKKKIAVSGEYSLNGSKISIKGKKDINMKDFNIEPPSVMFGTIVVGEMVNIEYDLILN